MFIKIAHRIGFVVLALVIASVPTVAQKIEAAGADLDQCANGTAASPEGCAGSVNWVNGNLNESKSHYAENQFIPYRMKFTGLSTSGSHTVTIGYDRFNGGTNAIDYLGSYNTTEAGADPCAGINPACGSSSTFAIPPDTATVSGVISPNTNLPIVQIPGVFTLFGGTITGVSAYGGSGDERTLTVTFTASQANPVLAWGGHIAWIGDWGAGGSAGTITGSPYHMRLKDLDGSGGNQDRSLKTTAVIQSGAVLIIKKIQTTLIDQANILFPFTATTSFDPLNFGLKDVNDGVQDRKLSLPINIFGAGNPVVVTETNAAPFTLNDIACVEAGAGSVADSTGNLGTASATIIVQAGETVTCTFTNGTLNPSAADVSISGRVTDRNGRSISGAIITVTDDSTGETYRARTNTFGYYSIDGLSAGDLFTATVSARRYTFPTSSLSFSLTDNLTGVDFRAN